MDFEQASDELYAVAPEDFVARRTALVAQAKAGGDRELAKRIGGLRRPTKTAWLVNLLAREASDEMAELLAIAAGLRSAQASRAGADVRRLSTERRRVVEALVRRAGALAAQQGRPANDATLQEVALTLQAGLADEDSAALVRSGRLTAAVSVGGFGGWDLGGSPATVAGPAGASAGADEAAEQGEPAADRAAREAQLEQLAREAEAARLAAETAAAERELADAQTAAELAAERADALRTELSAAEAAAAAAAARLDAALRRLVDLGASPHSA